MFQFSINAGKVKEPAKEEKTNESVVSKSENNDKAEDIRSVELLYTIAQNEYSNEYERTNMIHSKAGIALPIVSAYFFTLIQMNDYKSMLAMAKDFGSSLTASTMFLTYTISAAFALASVLYMAKVIFAKGYMRIDPENLYTADNLTQNHQEFMEKLMKIYFKAIEINRNANNSIMKNYKKGWIWAFCSVLCFVAYIVLKNNI